jgi:polysaccharide biosynthesis/export protein
MYVTVRGVLDWPKCFCIFALLMAGPGLQTALCQAKYETPQEANLRIEQLAALARAVPADVPVGPGDLLHIDVFDVPELSRDVRVTDSGEIGFPLVPERIQAAGLTPFQVERKIEEVLATNGLVVHPQVSVFLREQSSQPISVIGAVAHSTVMQASRPMTLLEVLAQAGGISDDAGADVVITRVRAVSAPQVKQISDVPDTAEGVAGGATESSHTITIRIQDLLESGNTDYNIQIVGGDIISIPRAGIVYILGFGISQPGGYVMQGHGDQVTVLKAIALAHGLTSFARADDSVILRNNPTTGKRDAIPVPLKKIQNHKADDIPLLSNDILYIPDSKGKKALARGVESALGIGTQVAIFRVP